MSQAEVSRAALDRASDRLSSVVPPQNLEAEESVLGAMNMVD